MGLELKGTFIVTEKVGKTKRQLFKDLQVDDTIVVVQDLKGQGTGSNGCYATRLKVYYNFETYHFTSNEFAMGMTNVKLKQIK